MAGTIAARLRMLGIELPAAQQPRIARIETTARTGALLFVSGQIPQWNGEIRFIGKVGAAFDLEAGRAAARLSMLNVLAHAQAALDGDLDRIVRFVKLTGFINAAPDFVELPQLLNAASEMVLDIFGEAGRHARTAVGVAVMPFDVAIEIEAVLEVR